MNDNSVFPDPAFKRNVLGPLFDVSKVHHVDGFRQIDRAHLVMLKEQGILLDEQAKTLAKALVDIDQTFEPAAQEYTGEVEDFFFLLEKELRERVGPDLAGRLHTARSRNDMDHTLYKLVLKERLGSIISSCLRLYQALVEKTEQHKTTLVIGYTHGQPAQPTTFGHYLSAIIEVLGRDIDRLFQALAIVDLSPMGAAAITTSGFPINRERMAELLGFEKPLQNSYSCIAAADYITATYSALELLFLHLGRPIQDFQFWSSFEVGQLYVPNSLVQISSIMPQKRNPVPIEHLRHLSSQAFARARSVLDIMHNTPFTDMNDSESETQSFGYQAFAVGERVLDLLTSLISQVSINSERVKENIRRSCVTITQLADSLVHREGISFREAHEVSAAVARQVVAVSGELATDGYPVFQQAFQEHVGRGSDINAEQFAEIVSPEFFVAVRERTGGPGKQAQESALASYRETFTGFQSQLEAIARRSKQAQVELNTSFQKLIGTE